MQLPFRLTSSTDDPMEAYAVPPQALVWTLKFGVFLVHQSLIKTDVKIKRGVAQLMPGLNMNDILEQDMAFKRTISPFALGWM